jgi:cytosylglucuronate decarboxylase
MCSFRWSNNEYRYSPSEANSLAKTARESGIRVVRFTGGEPLLHDGIADVISAFSTEGLLTSLITNGAFLENRCDELVQAGLTQVIISLDGYDEDHDRFRATPGLFKAALMGVQAIQAKAPQIRIRVNTVVGPHNFRELPKIYDFLCSMRIESWSLIPLKGDDGAWKYVEKSDVEAAHALFVAHVSANETVRILGDGLNWMGRNAREIDEFFTRGKVMTPRVPCQVVQHLRYYIPGEGKYFVCNCIPHRVGAMELAQEWCTEALTNKGLGKVGNWLHENGPNSCMGCEPINAAFGEGRIDIEDDPLGF